MSFLDKVDPEISKAIACEARRQKEIVNLIASENYASPAVLEAQGSFLTYKYAEGYPGRRYYGGCENMDTIEELAINRAKELFHAEHANVQPHSGSQANMAAYFALLDYGDTVMAMDLAHGGHLTHGSPAAFSGRSYKFVHYGVSRETGRIDFPQVEKLAAERRPKLILAGYTAYPRIIDFERFRRIADSVGARLMVDMAHIAGLVAAGLHPTPVPYADVVTTTTHKTLRGPSGGLILCRQKYARAIDAAVFPEAQGKPLMHAVAAKAVALHEAMQPGFIEYQRAILDNALVLATELKHLGFSLISGGTDNHLMLVDLADKGVTGRQAEKALDAAGIVVNKNAVPFDPRPPTVTSGIRLGTPAATTRGFGKEEMKLVASLIAKVISNIDDVKVQEEVRQEVARMCRSFPVPGID
ncbi:MAG: serine hydroxymethyltransferase [Chloroflexi bacterium RBG_16_56_11]|nr:MAG: serine hydroxymethyltransferase [Chloroflexi bacterium RBG_16_56_11]